MAQLDYAFYNRQLNPFVWVIEIWEKSSNFQEKLTKTWSGFALYKSNLIVTPACVDEVRPISSEGCVIRARKLFEVNSKVCKIKLEFLSLRLAVLEVLDMEEGDDNVLKLGNGDVNLGDTLFTIGGSDSCTHEGLLLMGTAGFDCKHVQFSLDSNDICGGFNNSVKCQFDLGYRIMGNFYNRDFFKHQTLQYFDRFTQLDPNIPIVPLNDIVECNGFDGSPLFNSVGEVVGIMYGGIYDFPAGIHVSVLHAIQRKLKEDGEKCVQGSMQESGRKSEKRSIQESGRKSEKRSIQESESESESGASSEKRLCRV